MTRFALAGLLFATTVAGCALEGTEAIDAHLVRLDADVAHGLATVERALTDPSLTFDKLGDGVREVHDAAEALEGWAYDVRATDGQQLTALVLEARAFDDLAQLFSTAAPKEGDAPSALQQILLDKALPAKSSARAAYTRAFEHVCQAGLETHPSIAEIMDGLDRYDATDDVVCAD